MADGFSLAAALLPQELRDRAAALPLPLREQTEEIRLRTGFPASLRLRSGEHGFGCGPVTEKTLAAVVENASRASYHAVADQLRRGYLSAPGGVRVGVCGTAVTDGGIRALRELSSLCIRVPRQIRDAGKSVIPLLRDGSVLILSAPGGGKTTFLRELIRTVSDSGTAVCVADERGELAGMWNGAPQFDLGRCTDVLTGAPKAEAAMLLLRAMGPEVVAMDEISAPEDAAAIETLLGCGVRIFATAHASGAEEFRSRPIYARLAGLGAFQKLVVIRGGGAREYEVERL